MPDNNQFCEDRFFKLVCENKIQEAIEYAKKHTPEYVYKYYSLSDDENLNRKKLDTLRNNQNWFDLSDNQNDPLDMKMASVDRNSSWKVTEKQLEDVESFLCQLSKSHVLCSFTSNDEFNLPMWQFYANQHKGYCVKYKINNKKALWRVLYNASRLPVLCIPRNYMNLCNKQERTEDDNALLEEYRYLMLLILNTKHDSWEREKEFRIIYPAEQNSGTSISNGGLGITPVCVYIGLKCSEVHRKEISEICAKHLECDCMQANVSDDKILDFERVQNVQTNI